MCKLSYLLDLAVGTVSHLSFLPTAAPSRTGPMDSWRLFILPVACFQVRPGEGGKEKEGGEV
jgi:hypothetical protein